MCSVYVHYKVMHYYITSMQTSNKLNTVWYKILEGENFGEFDELQERFAKIFLSKIFFPKSYFITEQHIVNLKTNSKFYRLDGS